jgi:hypothetical protein
MFNNYTQNTGLLKSEYVRFQDLKLREINLPHLLQHLILMSKKYMKLYKRNWLKCSETQFARQICVTFGSIYVCEQLILLMKRNKTPETSRIRGTHTCDETVMKLVLAQELKPSLV